MRPPPPPAGGSRWRPRSPFAARWVEGFAWSVDRVPRSLGSRTGRVDASIEAPVREVPADAVLLADGVFLQRPELRDAWDLTVFLRVPFADAVERARRRDAASGVDPETLAVLYAGRSVPGQELHLGEAEPAGRADVLIDHGGPQAPRALRGPEATNA